MNQLIKILILLSLILTKISAEFVVYKNELSEDAKILAMGITQEEILLNRNESAITDRIANEFSVIYGGSWLSFVGKKGLIDSLITQVSPAPNTLLWFAYNTTNVLVYQSQPKTSVTTLEVNYKNIITEALKYNITANGTSLSSYDVLPGKALNFIKQSLAENAMNCTTIAANNWNTSNCFNKISASILAKLDIEDPLSSWGFQFDVMVGILNSASIAKERYRFYYYVVFGNVLDVTIFDNSK